MQCLAIFGHQKTYEPERVKLLREKEGLPPVMLVCCAGLDSAQNGGALYGAALDNSQCC
jgi:hypothetical protein